MKLNPVSLSVQDDCSIGSKNLYSSVKLKCFTTLNGFPAMQQESIKLVQKLTDVQK